MAGITGYFLWHELMSTDPAGARSFYPAVTGWGVMPAGIPGVEYDMWTTDRGPIGGLMQLPLEAQSQGAVTNWVPYIGAADIDATFAQAKSLGAKVYLPVHQIPGIGRFAIMADPQGATFALYQPDGESPGEMRPEVGDFSWHEMAAPDAVGVMSFYGDLFGWQIVETHDMGPLGMYHLFGRDGHQFGGAFDRPSHMGPDASWLCYVRTASAEDGAASVSANGGAVLNGPMEVPGGDFIVNCMDPQGGLFALHQLPG